MPISMTGVIMQKLAYINGAPSLFNLSSDHPSSDALESRNYEALYILLDTARKCLGTLQETLI